jgi:hypothetical protein
MAVHIGLQRGHSEEVQTNFVIGITAALVLTSAALLLRASRRVPPDRSMIAAGMSQFLLSLALLIGFLIPSGPVETVTQVVFVGAAIWFMVLEWRLSRKA